MRGSNASLKQLAVGGKQTKIKIGKSGPSSQEQGEGYLCFEVGGHSSLSLSLSVALIHPLHMNDGVRGERGLGDELPASRHRSAVGWVWVNRAPNDLHGNRPRSSKKVIRWSFDDRDTSYL